MFRYCRAAEHPSPTMDSVVQLSKQTGLVTSRKKIAIVLINRENLQLHCGISPSLSKAPAMSEVTVPLNGNYFVPSGKKVFEGCVGMRKQWARQTRARLFVLPLNLV